MQNTIVIKKLFLALALLCEIMAVKSQTVSSLVATGTGIKWYAAATGGSALSASTPLVNGTTYYASQTVNGMESSLRMAVTAFVVAQAAPIAAANTPSRTQVVWNWNSSSGATGYKWSATNNYVGATDLSNILTKTETGLTCNTAYTRYVWAYNGSGCVSSVATLSQTTSSCVSAPTVVTSAASNTTATTTTLNGNVSATGGATVTTRGFKYSTSNGFNPATSGTNVSESGSFGTGVFTANLTGLATTTTYYAVGYATNSIGTTYGDQVVFNTLIQNDFAYTGGVQIFTVPEGVTNLTLEAWGAQGGTNGNDYSSCGDIGGKGGYAIGTLAVTPGESINIYVGGKGISGATGGYNGGGASGPDTGTCGSGGGASDIRIGGTALANRVLVAGGGGGAEYSACNGTGGDGGGLNGNDGSEGVANPRNGKGGSQSAGGAGGVGGYSGYSGILGQGGAYGGHPQGHSGGGGGGYYGGGGSSEDGHGGGGSSYVGGVTSGTTTAGLNTGNGRIKISY